MRTSGMDTSLIADQDDEHGLLTPANPNPHVSLAPFSENGVDVEVWRMLGSPY